MENNDERLARLILDCMCKLGYEHQVVKQLLANTHEEVWEMCDEFDAEIHYDQDPSPIDSVKKGMDGNTRIGIAKSICDTAKLDDFAYAAAYHYLSNGDKEDVDALLEAAGETFKED